MLKHITRIFTVAGTRGISADYFRSIILFQATISSVIL